MVTTEPASKPEELTVGRHPTLPTNENRPPERFRCASGAVTTPSTPGVQ